MTLSTSIKPRQLDQFSMMMENFKDYRSFQTQIVIEAIVSKEQKRIERERMGWKMAGAAVGLLLGAGDGLDFGDFFTAFTFGNIANLAHNKFSEKDIQFLKEIKSYWMIADGSPVDILRRLGAPKSRVLIFANDQALAFTHHVGPRGEFLVPLSSAGQTCPGFTDQQSREVVERCFELQDVDILKNQLYPTLDGALQVDSSRLLRKEVAVQREPDLVEAAVTNGYAPVDLEIGGEKVLAFRTQVPLHSDF
ncbi:hypothetical protein N8478_00820 [bacterium]|nr:hypothetical protein [bacterium]